MDSEIPTETDVLVVGAGPGGYVAAIRAAQLGLETTLVDRDAVGGACLNYGCIPSKALLTATGRVQSVTNAEAEEMGINAEADIDVGQLVDWKDRVVDTLTGGVRQLCRANGVTFVEGHAEFIDTDAVRIRGTDSEIDIGFSDVIIATGSRPIELPEFPFDAEPVLDSRGALAISSAPKRLVTIGAGYIGMELSTVFARLGTDVTVVEMLDEPLPGYGPELTRPVKRRLESLGVEFQFGEAALEYQKSADGVTVFTERENGDIEEYAGEKILVAIGRTPVTDGLGLDVAGIETTEAGIIETDNDGRTGVDGIYAVGDVAGEPMLAHKASHEGIRAAETIAGEGTDTNWQPVPAVVFTEPEIGTIGIDEAEAREEGLDPIVGEFPFSASGRALTRNEGHGFVRLVAAGETGQIVGCQAVGPEVSELLAEVGVAMRCGLAVEELADTIHTHPTLSEAVMEAAANTIGSAIHTSN